MTATSEKGCFPYRFNALSNKNMQNAKMVLNGITFLPNDHMLITGKNWNHLYEIELKD
ncbi:MAG: glutaminyl-peptide cyclotransferase [Weeksellaceae bacterium]